MRGVTVVVCGLVLGLVAGLSPAWGQRDGGDKLRVAVSILPQQYFVERVGGAHVDVMVLVGPGQSPHAYEPTPREMARLSEAKVYFRMGVEFEASIVPRVERMFPQMKMVDLRKNVPLRMMETRCTHGHDHGEHGQGHVHEVKDPHIWLSPRLVKIQARTICETLCELDPVRAGTYRENLKAFHADLDKVHDEIAAALKPLRGKEVFVFHPAYGYFLDEFGLEQVPVEVEGKEPTGRQLAHVIERAQEAGVKVIFVQPQFSKKSAEAVAEAIDGVVVPLDPLAKAYLENLREIKDRIKAKFQQ